MNDKTLLPTELEISPAGRWIRLLAKLVDGFIFMIPVFALFVIVTSSNLFQGRGGFEDRVLTTSIFITLIFLCMSILIFNLELLYRNGQTIGKSLFAIKIVRLDGSRAGLFRIIFLRFLPIGILSSIPFVALLDPLLIFQKSRRCLHDLIADTIVVDGFGDSSSCGSNFSKIVVNTMKVFVIAVIFAVIMTPLMMTPDTINRSKVTEAMMLLNGAKTEVSTYIKDYGKFPSTLGESVITSGNYVASIELNSQKYYIQATMKEDNSPVGGKRLKLTYVAVINTWICSTDFWGGMDEKYLPKTCRKERRLEFAQKMQQAGMDIDTIATITGLNPEAIQYLKNNRVNR